MSVCMSRLLWARLITLEVSIVIDEDRTDINDHDPTPLKKHKGPNKATPKPVFKFPPGFGSYYGRALQENEHIVGSNRSSEVSGGSQGRCSTWISNPKVKRCLTFHRKPSCGPGRGL